VEAKTVTQWDSAAISIHVHGCSFQLGQQVSQLFIGFDLLGQIMLFEEVLQLQKEENQIKTQIRKVLDYTVF
jgi:hypothetical protein